MRNIVFKKGEKVWNGNGQKGGTKGDVERHKQAKWFLRTFQTLSLCSRVTMQKLQLVKQSVVLSYFRWNPDLFLS